MKQMPSFNIIMKLISIIASVGHYYMHYSVANQLS